MNDTTAAKSIRAFRSHGRAGQARDTAITERRAANAGADPVDQPRPRPGSTYAGARAGLDRHHTTVTRG